MTTIEFMVYGGLAFTLLAARFIGKSLDQRHSFENNQRKVECEWKTGVFDRKTVIQSLVLGLIVAPIVYILKNVYDKPVELWYCVVMMMAAPFIVDMLKPKVTVTNK